VADEILSGSGGGNNILVTAIGSKMALLLLADRASMRNHGALINLGDNLVGSTTEQFTQYGLDGYDLMSSVTEIQSVSNQALTTAKKTVAPARHALAYDWSDYLETLDQTGQINSQRLALSIVQSANMTFTNNLAKMVDDFATVVGSTTVAYTHDTFLAGQFKLKQNKVPGPYVRIFKPKMFTDWQADLEARGGVTQWRAATEEMQMLRGLGFEGTYNGMEVFTSDQVQSANAGADWAGGSFGRGALGFKELKLKPAPRSAFIILEAGVVRVEEVRNGRTEETAVRGTYYHGFVEIEDLRGVTELGAQ
jgi:hypothetical protein